MRCAELPEQTFASVKRGNRDHPRANRVWQDGSGGVVDYENARRTGW
jgi:hypothetical protein